MLRFKNIRATVALLRELGLTIHAEKLVLVPTQHITGANFDRKAYISEELDNTTAVAYINKKGGTISASCSKLAKNIWNWAKGQDIWIIASHVPGVKNTTADLRSRFCIITKSGL